jgi:hypothetical protein
MPFKNTRRLAGGSKNSTYNFNRPITRENILLGFLTEISEKSKNRFLNTKSRETLIFSDNDRKSFSQNKLQFSPTDIGKKSNIMAVPKPILPFPNIFSTSHFTKTGITNFFINYKNICENYNIEEKERIRRYFRYYIKHITITIRELASFIEPD